MSRGIVSSPCLSHAQGWYSYFRSKLRGGHIADIATKKPSCLTASLFGIQVEFLIVRYFLVELIRIELTTS